MSRIEVQSYANTNDFKFQFDSLGTTVFNRGIYTINNIKYPKEMLETGNNVVVYIVLDSTCYEKINTEIKSIAHYEGQSKDPDDDSADFFYTTNNYHIEVQRSTASGYSSWEIDVNQTSH